LLAPKSIGKQVCIRLKKHVAVVVTTEYSKYMNHK